MGVYEIEQATRADPRVQSPGETLRLLIAELHASGLPLNAHSNAYENAIRVKSGPGYLIGFTVYNSKNAAQLIQWHDTKDAPASGAVPCGFFSLATVADREFYFNTPGRSFLRGIWLVNSSTGPTYTAGSADCFFDAQFI